ncbi:MAG: metallophosphoesterase [Chloroflexota bacterium]
MTRIAFTADLHIDAYGSRIDPATGLNARLLDYLATLRFVADEATRQSASALVVAGDFTERRHPAPWLVAKIRDALSGGPSAQLYLRGNHDGEIDGRSIVSILDDGYGSSLLDESGRLGVSRPQLVPVAFDAVVAAVPYLDRHWLRAQPGFQSVPDADLFRVLGDQFLTIARGLYAEARRDYPDAGVVLVCHQTLAGAAMSDSQRAFLGDVSLVVDSRALADVGFEAVVAGHLHRHQVVVPSDRPVLYAGSIERVDFGEEGEEKGFVVADVGPGRFDWEFVPTPARRFVTLREECGYNLDDVRDAIVRCVDVDPELDVAHLRSMLEADGAFEVVSIQTRRPESTVAAGGLSEALAPAEALEEYFVADPDREVLVGRGRELLAEVA